MICENAKEFTEKMNFPKDAREELLTVLEKCSKCSDFSEIVSRYGKSDFDFYKALEDIKSFAERSDICEYTAYMLLFVCMLPELHNKYKQKGISDKIFYDTICDLKYKLEECRLVYGKNGTFVPEWYAGIFDLKIIALGRLQFETKYIDFECDAFGRHIAKGKKVLGIHIPRTGTRLEHESVLDSYRRAKEFFMHEYGEEIIFMCDSWLLYPWNRTVLNGDSNLSKFYDDFEIVKSNDHKNYSEVWRLFDCLYDGDVKKLPDDTSLRRAYIQRISSNKPIGSGTGIMVF